MTTENAWMKIPADQHDRIRELYRESEKADIRLKCCQSRLRIAIAGGSTDAAIAESFDAVVLARAIRQARGALNEAVRDFFPEFGQDGKQYELDPLEMLIRRSELCMCPACQLTRTGSAMFRLPPGVGGFNGPGVLDEI